MVAYLKRERERESERGASIVEVGKLQFIIRRKQSCDGI